MTQRIPSIKCLLLLCLVLAKVRLSGQAIPEPPFSISTAPSISFTHDSTWRGGDGASTIDLENGTILWLFGDTFISDGGSRSEAAMIRNSIGIQTVSEERADSIRFWFRGTPGNPSPVFYDSEEEWLWPGHGVMIEGKCLIFMMVLSHSSNDLGFESSGWKLAVIHNPLEAPERWDITYHEGKGPEGILIGTSAVLLQDQHLYAFGVQESQEHETYLFRFPVNMLHGDSLQAPQLWDGEVWQPSYEEIGTIPPLFHGQTEFSVHFESTLNAYLQVQTVGFGRATIVGRTADQVTGPWSPPFPIYQPPLSSDSQIIYAAKAHPELSSDKVMITYQVNDLDFEALLEDESVYFPRMITVSWE